VPSQEDDACTPEGKGREPGSDLVDPLAGVSTGRRAMTEDLRLPLERAIMALARCVLRAPRGTRHGILNLKDNSREQTVRPNTKEIDCETRRRKTNRPSSSNSP
jgi:hypothetical protein